MRKYVLLGALAALCGFTSTVKDDAASVSKAANSNMQAMLRNIPAGSERQFGFANREEINDAVIGYPYHVLGLSKEFFSSPQLAGDPTGYVTMSTEWRVPVLVDGEYRMLVTVTGEAGNYNAADIGGAGLAHELQETCQLKSGHSYYILRVYQLTADILVDAPNGDMASARYIPLTSAHMALPSLTGNSYSATETLLAIKTAIAKLNLKN